MPENLLLPKEVIVIVKEVKQETPDTKSFRVMPSQPIAFYAGQFLVLNIDIDGQKFLRSYSIASPPSSQMIELVVKKTGVTSKFLIDKVLPGHVFGARAPYGRCYYTRDMGDHVVLMGAGSGIAPLMGILRHILENFPEVQVVLFYSNKTPEDIIYHEEFKRLASQHLNFTCVLTVTVSKDSNWKSLVGRINQDLVKQYVSHIAESVYYICGPPLFVDDMGSLVKGLGADGKKIKVEKFL